MTNGNKEVVDVVNVVLTSDYTVEPIYYGSRMLICRGLYFSTGGTMKFTNSVGDAKTLTVVAGQMDISGVQKILSTSNGTTVGAITILYG